MGTFIQDEIQVFLEAAWYGMLITASYEILRILRRVIKHGDIWVGIQDFLFWVISGMIMFAMIFRCNDGVVRGYIFIAFLIGAYLYHQSISFWIVKYISKILNFILTFLLKKPLKWARIIFIRFVRVLTLPFRMIIRQMKNVFKGVVKKHGKHNDEKKEKRKARDTRH